jgi:peptide/nickel transport system substrate-binding protein
MSTPTSNAFALSPTRRDLLKVSLAAAVVGGPLARGATRAAAASGRRFTYAYKSDLQTTDPQLTTDSTTQMVHFQIFEPLVKMGRSGQFEGVLAESWETPDDLTWRFHLRQGVTFHNGDPFTADDVTFSLDRIRKPELKSPAASGLDPIASITKVDDHTVDVKTTAPYAALLSILYGGLSIVPAQYLTKVGDDGFAANPVGTGPFTFVKWTKDVEVQMAANPHHWRGAPAISELIFRPIPEDSARIAALQNQEVDWIAALSVERVGDFENNDQIKIGTRPGQGIYAQMDTVRTKPFMSRDVRQAINHAVNVDSIIKDLLDGRATRLPSVFFSATPGFDPNMAPYSYDPDLARQLLAKAGYADGFEVTFDVPPGLQAAQKLQEVGEAIAQDLSQVGVKAKLEIQDPTVFTERYHNSEYQFFISAWGSSHESGRYVDTLLESHRRGYYYRNPDADKLIDAFMQTIDPQKRIEAGKAANQYLFDDAPWLFLYQEPDIYGYLKDVVWEPNPADIYFHAYEVTFA